MENRLENLYVDKRMPLKKEIQTVSTTGATDVATS